METQPGGNKPRAGRTQTPREEPLRMFNFPVRLRQADLELIHAEAGPDGSTLQWVQGAVDQALAAAREGRRP